MSVIQICENSVWCWIDLVILQEQKRSEIIQVLQSRIFVSNKTVLSETFRLVDVAYSIAPMFCQKLCSTWRLNVRVCWLSTVDQACQMWPNQPCLNIIGTSVSVFWNSWNLRANIDDHPCTVLPLALMPIYLSLRTHNTCRRIFQRVLPCRNSTWLIGWEGFLFFVSSVTSVVGIDRNRSALAWPAWWSTSASFWVQPKHTWFSKATFFAELSQWSRCFSLSEMTLPCWYVSKIWVRSTSSFLSHRKPASGWPYRFRSRRSTGSSVASHCFGFRLGGRLILHLWAFVHWQSSGGYWQMHMRAGWHCIHGCVAHVNVRWSVRFSSLCRLRCAVAQISSHVCRFVFRQRVRISCPDSSWSGRRIDKHPRDESPLTSVRGTGYLLRLLSRRTLSLDVGGMAMRTSFKPRAAIHELARPFRPVMQGCDIINSHLLGGLERPAGFQSVGVWKSCPWASSRFLSSPVLAAKAHLSVLKDWTLGFAKINWLTLRTMARCENAILALWDTPVLPQCSGSEMVETEESNSSSGFTPGHPQIPAHHTESIAGIEQVEGTRGCKVIRKTLSLINCLRYQVHQRYQGASPPREHAQYGLRGDRTGDAEPWAWGRRWERLFWHVSSNKIDVLLCVMGVHSPGNGTEVFFPVAADAEVDSWQARPVHAREPFAHNQRVSYARNQRSVPVQDSVVSIPVDPDLAVGQGDRIGQEEELVDRRLTVAFVNWFASMCTSVMSQTVEPPLFLGLGPHPSGPHPPGPPPFESTQYTQKKPEQLISRNPNNYRKTKIFTCN